MVNVLLHRVIALLLQTNLTVAGINYCQIVEYVSFRWVTIQLLADMENVFKYSNDSSLSGGFAFVFINKKYPFISLHNLHMHINNSCMWKQTKTVYVYWESKRDECKKRAFKFFMDKIITHLCYLKHCVTEKLYSDMTNLTEKRCQVQWPLRTA